MRFFGGNQYFIIYLFLRRLRMPFSLQNVLEFGRHDYAKPWQDSARPCEAEGKAWPLRTTRTPRGYNTRVGYMKCMISGTDSRQPSAWQGLAKACDHRLGRHSPRLWQNLATTKGSPQRAKRAAYQFEKKHNGISAQRRKLGSKNIKTSEALSGVNKLT